MCLNGFVLIMCFAWGRLPKALDFCGKQAHVIRILLCHGGAGGGLSVLLHGGLCTSTSRVACT